MLKRRKRFIKLVICTGADVVSVRAFGENDIYKPFDAGVHPYVHKARLVAADPEIDRIYGLVLQY